MDRATHRFATGEIGITDPESGGLYLLDADHDPSSTADLQRLASEGNATFVDADTLDRVSDNLSSVGVLA